jgi:hypothetical protein
VASALEIPLVITQQYTKVFGPTIADVFADPAHLDRCPVFEKKQFSMCTDEVRAHLETLTPRPSSVVIFGIEAHVCVQQTCLDLLEQGRDVHVIVDAVTSQQPYDREIALTRLGQAGAYLTTAQSAAFMLMRGADHPNFKGRPRAPLLLFVCGNIEGHCVAIQSFFLICCCLFSCFSALICVCFLLLACLLACLCQFCSRQQTDSGAHEAPQRVQ